MKSKREKGDEGEKFVADYLRNIGFVVQIHPRTFRIIYIKGKPIQISADNDYHSCFDLLAEGLEKMIYIQVKATQDRKITRDIARAKANIEKNYIYTFPYVRVQGPMRKSPVRPGRR